jgi:outer membrane immunogenic protein
MKKILLAGALALIAAPALAADLPRRTAAVAPAPVYAAPVFTWTGFYVGAQAGYGWGKDKYSIVSAPAVAPFSTSPTGVLGGVHAGYNWQSGAFVYGLEADLEYANQKDKHSITAPAALTFSSTIGTSGSLRLRAGYAFDRTLLYVTAGLAGADIKQTVLNGAITTKTSGVEYGWTAGVGLEHAFTQNWFPRPPSSIQRTRRCALVCPTVSAARRARLWPAIDLNALASFGEKHNSRGSGA